jgi:hypothetical protein
MILAKRIVERARRANQMRTAHLFEKRAQEAEANSSFLRKLLLSEQKDDIGDEVMQTGAH